MPAQVFARRRRRREGEQAVRTRAGGVDAGERADIAYEVSEGIPNRIC